MSQTHSRPLPALIFACLAGVSAASVAGCGGGGQTGTASTSAGSGGGATTSSGTTGHGGDASASSGASAGTGSSCTDADGDKHGVGCPAGPDCDDTNPAAFDLVSLYTDADGDGYTVEPPGSAAPTCIGASTPAGFATTSKGVDCDDTSAQLTTHCPSVLLRDINVVPDPNPSSAPHGLTPTASGLGTYFAAGDARDGVELWHTDGTAAGTKIVVDLVPGPTDSNPRSITTFGESAYFLASTPELGDELWKTDGTAAGTSLVADLVPGPAGIGVGATVTVGNRLYFMAKTVGPKYELWQTDGDAASTQKVPLFTFTLPGSFTPLGNSLFFLATLSGGQALLKADATGLHQVYPAVGTLQLGQLTRIGAYVYYVDSQLDIRRADESGDALVWSGQTLLPPKPTPSCAASTNGVVGHLVASAGVHPVAFDITSTVCGLSTEDHWFVGTPGSAPVAMNGFSMPTVAGYFGQGTTHLAAQGGVTYFSAYTTFNGGMGPRVLWKWDGAVATQVMTMAGSGVEYESLTPTSSGVYWIGPAGPGQTGLGQALWHDNAVTTVTKANGWASLAPVAPTAAGFYLLSPNKLSFMSAGSTSPTLLVTPINVDAANIAAVNPTGATALFAADDGTTGTELWTSVGHPADTALLDDIATAPGSSFPGGFTELGSAVFFTADDGTTGTELWRSDGTTAGTEQELDVWAGNTSSGVANLSAIDGVLYFSANDGYAGNEFWASLGVIGDPVRVADIYGGVHSTGSGQVANDSNPGPFVSFGGKVYFAATDGPAGDAELYSYAGSGMPGAVSLVKAVNPDPMLGSYPRSLTVAGNKLFFIADDGASGEQLWVSDGTAAATIRLKQGSQPSASLHNSYLVAVGQKVFFAAVDATKGRELWVSDGTLAGTVLADDINTTGDSNPDQFAVLGTTLYFAATDAGGDRELWMKAGAAPAQRVADVDPTGSAAPDLVVAATDRVFFVADDGVHGRELCVTKGTSATTSCLDLLPGVRSAHVTAIVAVGPGLVVFSASDGVSGVELWQSDGTPAGTRLADDIAPGAGSSNPAALVWSPTLSRVFFQADDGKGGVELRAITRASLGP
jgi:ELWxxDGT repeat protein